MQNSLYEKFHSIPPSELPSQIPSLCLIIQSSSNSSSNLSNINDLFKIWREIVQKKYSNSDLPIYFKFLYLIYQNISSFISQNPDLKGPDILDINKTLSNFTYNNNMHNETILLTKIFNFELCKRKIKNLNFTPNFNKSSLEEFEIKLFDYSISNENFQDNIIKKIRSLVNLKDENKNYADRYRWQIMEFVKKAFFSKKNEFKYDYIIELSAIWLDVNEEIREKNYNKIKKKKKILIQIMGKLKIEHFLIIVNNDILKKSNDDPLILKNIQLIIEIISILAQNTIFEIDKSIEFPELLDNMLKKIQNCKITDYNNNCLKILESIIALIMLNSSSEIVNFTEKSYNFMNNIQNIPLYLVLIIINTYLGIFINKKEIEKLEDSLNLIEKYVFINSKEKELNKFLKNIVLINEKLIQIYSDFRNKYPMKLFSNFFENFKNDKKCFIETKELTINLQALQIYLKIENVLNPNEKKNHLINVYTVYMIYKSLYYILNPNETIDIELFNNICDYYTNFNNFDEKNKQNINFLGIISINLIQIKEIEIIGFSLINKLILKIIEYDKNDNFLLVLINILPKLKNINQLEISKIFEYLINLFSLNLNEKKENNKKIKIYSELYYFMFFNEISVDKIEENHWKFLVLQNKHFLKCFLTESILILKKKIKNSIDSKELLNFLIQINKIIGLIMIKAKNYIQKINVSINLIEIFEFFIIEIKEKNYFNDEISAILQKFYLNNFNQILINQNNIKSTNSDSFLNEILIQFQQILLKNPLKTIKYIEIIFNICSKRLYLELNRNFNNFPNNPIDFCIKESLKTYKIISVFPEIIKNFVGCYKVLSFFELKNLKNKEIIQEISQKSLFFITRLLKTLKNLNNLFKLMNCNEFYFQILQIQYLIIENLHNSFFSEELLFSKKLLILQELQKNYMDFYDYKSYEEIQFLIEKFLIKNKENNKTDFITLKIKENNKILIIRNQILILDSKKTINIDEACNLLNKIILKIEKKKKNKTIPLYILRNELLIIISKKFSSIKGKSALSFSLYLDAYKQLISLLVINKIQNDLTPPLISEYDFYNRFTKEFDKNITYDSLESLKYLDSIDFPSYFTIFSMISEIQAELLLILTNNLRIWSKFDAFMGYFISFEAKFGRISEIMRLWSSIDSLITSNPLIIISPIENFQAFENFCSGKSDLLFKHFNERRNSMINVNNINKIWVEIKEFIGNNQDLIHFNRELSIYLLKQYHYSEKINSSYWEVHLSYIQENFCKGRNLDILEKIINFLEIKNNDNIFLKLFEYKELLPNTILEQTLFALSKNSDFNLDNFDIFRFLAFDFDRNFLGKKTIRNFDEKYNLSFGNSTIPSLRKSLMCLKINKEENPLIIKIKKSFKENSLENIEKNELFSVISEGACGNSICFFKILEDNREKMIVFGVLDVEFGCYIWKDQRKIGFFIDFVKEFKDAVRKYEKEIQEIHKSKEENLKKCAQWNQLVFHYEKKLDQLLNNMDEILGDLLLIFLGNIDYIPFNQELKEAENEIMIFIKEIIIGKIEISLISQEELRFLQFIIGKLLYKADAQNLMKSISNLKHLFSLFSYFSNKDIDIFYEKILYFSNQIQSKYSYQLQELYPKSVYLLLDPELQALCFESFPRFILYRQTFYRLPCLSFLLNDINRYKSSSNSFLILNPQGDLLNTQKKIYSIWNRKWQNQTCFLGKAPPMEAMMDCLKRKDLYFYIGHGAGADILPESQLKNIGNINSIAIVFGCSSARQMISSNITKKDDLAGISNEFLMSGCPLYLGSLWDILDKDSDAIAGNIIETLQNNNVEKDLAILLFETKKICKNKCLNGNSFVLYGLQMKIK